MHFLAPFAFFFAAALPVVVLFYLLKRRRVVRLIPSTLLWQKFLADTQASAPFQKLRHNWLLILQLLLLLLAILALSRPYFSAKSEGGRLQVVILDTSASMQSTDVSPSRFEHARSEALRLVDAMHDTDQMVLLVAGASAQVRQSATSAKSALRRALQASSVSDTPTHLADALKLAETLIQNRTTAEIHLFSDGAVPALEEFENSGLPLIYHQTGTRSENIGITGLDVRPNPENPSERAVFASVSNTSTNTRLAQLELHRDGQLLEVKTVTLAPGQTVPQVFLASQDEDAILSVHLTDEDDLLIDNQASVVSLLPRPVRIRLASPGNQLLAKALRVIPNVILTESGVSPGPDESFDLVVLDNVNPQELPAGNLLSFNIARKEWFDSWTTLPSPPIVDWKNAHPLLRFVNFDNVQIAESLSVKTPSWAASLVDSPQTGLILAGELGRRRIVWVGFDPLQSTWPLRISFPIFIANAVDWLNPASITASQRTIQAGTPFRLALTEPITEAEINLPDGSKQTLEVNPQTGELVFADTASLGTYRITAGTNQIAFCVNLLDDAESNTTPKSELSFGKYAKADSTELRRANLEIWRWIAAASLTLLMLEWWYYHRRTA
jgi:Ca-activated chloride channel homolog